MGELLNKFFIWLRKPDPDTILIKLWRKKRDRDSAIKEIEAKRKVEEDRQKVQEQAYLLWEADGKLEGRDDYYWKLATDKVKGKNLPTLYKPYYFLEKRILEPIDVWIAKQAFFTILGRLGSLALVVAVVSFVFGENVRRNSEVFSAWQTITSAYEQSGSGGRIRALEFLNSRPLRFPWVWVTIDLFGDEKECERKLVFGRRWKREPLVGLSTPKAYLGEINLCGVNLFRANLQHADLFRAMLQEANLLGANLQNAILIETKNLTLKQIKSTCFWDRAIYKGEWNKKKLTYVAIEPDNTNYIEELKDDTVSDLGRPTNCSSWEKEE